MESAVLVIVIVLILAAGIGWFILRRRPGGTSTAVGIQTVGSKFDAAAPSPPLRQTAPPMPQGDALAVLEVVEGPDAFVAGVPVGKHIEIRERRMTIGRNPKQVDIQLYSLEETSSVSRLHCSLEFHEALQCFFLTDEGSSSGTKVDGRSITPHKGHSLKDGDLIELGGIVTNGAILRFHSSYNPPERLSVEPAISPRDTLRQNIAQLGLRGTAPLRQDVFISYSRRDRDAMHRIREALTAANLTVWSDEDLEPGSPSWRADVQRAIENASCAVAILSPDAKSSEWVSEELGYARIRKLRLFTVLARGDESNAIPLGLTGVQWIDMRSDYESGIADLVQQNALDQLVVVIREHLGK